MRLGTARRVALLALLCFPALRAQTPAGANVYRANCAFCHGLDARGGRGPNLFSSHTQGFSDDALRSIVRNGIPGTGMPAFEMDPDELTALVSWVHSLGAKSGNSNETAPGDPSHGKQLYASLGCAGCHAIGNSGSIYGPDLTRVGAARSLPYLRESILKPSADIAEGYEGVTVNTRAGKRLTGVRLNEDTFSVQIRLPDGSVAAYLKSELRDSEDLTRSLMPAYASLSPSDLDDLVSYLATLRGQATGDDVSKVKGVH